MICQTSKRCKIGIFERGVFKNVVRHRKDAGQEYSNEEYSKNEKTFKVSKDTQKQSKIGQKDYKKCSKIVVQNEYSSGPM